MPSRNKSRFRSNNDNNCGASKSRPLTKEIMNTVTQKEERSVRSQPVSPERPHTSHVSPNVNIIETKDGYILEAEMPGVAKEGLEVSLEENVLTIVGRRQADPSANLVYRESNPVDYRRVFELDPTIDTGTINAQMEQGILTLTLPKAEKVKPRQITVN
jgi:HSP20 family protein